MQEGNRPYPIWKIPVESSTTQPTASTAGIPHPTMLYLRKLMVMSEGCLDVSLTVNLKK